MPSSVAAGATGSSLPSKVGADSLKVGAASGSTSGAMPLVPGYDDDRVVDSRLAEDGAAIRRRRECLVCERRYTDFERVESAVDGVKRLGLGNRSTGRGDPWPALCHKNRPVTEAQLVCAVQEVEDAVRESGTRPRRRKWGWPSSNDCPPWATLPTVRSPALQGIRGRRRLSTEVGSCQDHGPKATGGEIVSDNNRGVSHDGPGAGDWSNDLKRT